MSNGKFKTVELSKIEVKENLKKIKFNRDDEKIRVGFVSVKEGDPVLIIPVSHFKFNEKYEKSFQVTGDDEFDKKVARLMGDPVVKFVAPVVRYNTDAHGAVLDDNYSIEPFVIPESKISLFQSISMEFPLADHDIVLTAVKGKLDFQEYTATPTKKSHWKASMKDDVIAKFAELDYSIYADAVSIDVSKEKITEWLEMDAPTEQDVPEQTEVTDENMKAMLID